MVSRIFRNIFVDRIGLGFHEVTDNIHALNASLRYMGTCPNLFAKGEIRKKQREKGGSSLYAYAQQQMETPANFMQVPFTSGRERMG